MTRILVIDPQFADTDAYLEHDLLVREMGEHTVTLEIARPVDGVVPAQTLASADAVINCRSRHRITADVVDRLAQVRIIIQAGVGFNHIDLAACAARGIPVCNTPDYGTTEVADHAMALVLSLLRATVAYDARCRRDNGAWNTLSLPVPPVRRVRGQVFGIIGLGRIGLATAQRARAFDLSIAFYDPYLPPGIELALGIRRCQSLAELLGLADIVSLHCPLTNETHQLIDDAAVVAMKPGAVLVNTARGAIVDLDAVERGLRSGHLCAAGLDVLPVEPPERNHPLLAAWSAGEGWLEGRLIVTPHAAFFTPESRQDMRRLSLLAAVQYLRDGQLRSCVNLALLEQAAKG